MDRERKEKMEASLRERQKEVERERENQAHRWGREREMHRKEETLERFKAFLIDMVRRMRFNERLVSLISSPGERL